MILFIFWGYLNSEVFIIMDEENINFEDFIENEEWVVFELM